MFILHVLFVAETFDVGFECNVLFFFLCLWKLQVLMFPYLMEDQFLTTEFETFIEAMDNSHELALAGHQQYPVYILALINFMFNWFSDNIFILQPSNLSAGSLCFAFSEK